MRYPLLTAVALCLCGQVSPGLAAGNGYHAGNVLLADASGDQFQVQDDTPPTVPEDNLPPVQPLDQSDMADQTTGTDQTDQSGQSSQPATQDQGQDQSQEQDQSQNQPDDQGNQDSSNSNSPQSQPASQESDQNQEDERAIRRMCQEYSQGLPDDEKAQYLQDCIRSQSY